MKNGLSNVEKDFFETGVRTYVDVDDAMTEFHRLVQHKCGTAASKRLDELNRVCGMHWTVKELHEYFEKTVDHHYLGKQFEVKGLGKICFCLRISREDDGRPFDAFVFLSRIRRDLATGLWERSEESTAVTWKGRNNLGFGQPLPEGKIPDFEAYLGQAVTDFLAFINESGGLQKYLSS